MHLECQTYGEAGPGFPNAFCALNPSDMQAGVAGILDEQAQSFLNPFGIFGSQAGVRPLETVGVPEANHRLFFLTSSS